LTADSTSSNTPAGAAAAGGRMVLATNNGLALVYNVAWAVATPFIPLYIAAQGASVAVIGVVVGVSGILPLLLAVHAGALVDERGPTAVSRVSVVLFAAAGAILVWFQSIPGITIAYTLMGLGNIGLIVASQTVVAAASPAAHRMRNYGYYALWTSAGSVLGPVLGGLAAQQWGYRAAFALVLVLMVPAFALAMSMRVPPTSRQAVSLGTALTHAGAIVRRTGITAILWFSFMVVCAQALKQSFYPIYLQKVGFTTTMIGLAFAADSLCSMATRPFLTRNVARFGQATLLLGATSLAAVSLGVTPLLRTFWPLVLSSALMGASGGVTMPLTMHLMAESVAAEFWGVALGVRQGVQRFASVVSPIAFGLVITAFGIESGFFLGAATLAGAVPIMRGVVRHLHWAGGTWSRPQA